VTLEERWQNNWAELNLALPDPAIFEDLLKAYSEAHRAYHTSVHLDECFSWLDRTRELAACPAAVQLALWFHDSIYNTHSMGNEERSAAWAVQVLGSVGATLELQDSIRSMILATKHDASVADRDAALTADIDFTILGAPPARFAQYESQIRKEYPWVPDNIFRAKRAQILRSFLNRSAIFSLDYFRDLLEPQARSNLEESLVRLRG
jgi:predicted metal-dependent HD superfamily phosphohydrolase